MNKNKRIYLSKKDKKLGGVLGGIAEYLEVDSTILRVIYVLITVFTGFIPGLIAYLIIWLVIPERPNNPESSLAE